MLGMPVLGVHLVGPCCGPGVVWVLCYEYSTVLVLVLVRVLGDRSTRLVRVRVRLQYRYPARVTRSELRAECVLLKQIIQGVA